MAAMCSIGLYTRYPIYSPPPPRRGSRGVWMPECWRCDNANTRTGCTDTGTHGRIAYLMMQLTLVSRNHKQRYGNQRYGNQSTQIVADISSS